jgi:hypothetical protein
MREKEEANEGLTGVLVFSLQQIAFPFPPI